MMSSQQQDWIVTVVGGLSTILAGIMWRLSARHRHRIVLDEFQEVRVELRRMADRIDGMDERLGLLDEKLDELAKRALRNAGDIKDLRDDGEERSGATNRLHRRLIAVEKYLNLVEGG